MIGKKQVFWLLGLIWLPFAAGAQYDARQLTDLYRQTLQSRILTERILTDVVLWENRINEVETRKKLEKDLHSFQDLVEKTMQKVPEGEANLKRLYDKWKKKTDVWISLVNDYMAGKGKMKDIFKWAQSVKRQYESLRAHVELLLGFSKESLDNFGRLVEAYTVQQRSFAAYVIDKKGGKVTYAKEYKGDHNKWDTAIEALRKIRKTVDRNSEGRREANLLLTDLLFFRQAEARGYDPAVLYTPFVNFDAKFDTFFNYIFKTNPWI